MQVGVNGQVGHQVAYSSDLGRLLGLGGERRGEARRHGREERTSVHTSLRLAE